MSGTNMRDISQAVQAARQAIRMSIAIRGAR
jgi:hypothetical protein